MKRQRMSSSSSFQHSNTLEVFRKTAWSPHLQKNASMQKYFLMLNLIFSTYTLQSSAFQLPYNTEIQSNSMSHSYSSSFHCSSQSRNIFSQSILSRKMSQDNDENNKSNQDIKDDSKNDKKRLNSIMKNRAMAALGNAQDDNNDFITSSSVGESDDQSHISKKEEDSTSAFNKNKSQFKEPSSTFSSLLPPRIQAGSSPEDTLLPAMTTNSDDINNNKGSRNVGRRGKKNPRAKIQKRSLLKRKKEPSASSSSSSSILPPLPPLPPINNFKTGNAQQSVNNDSNRKELGPLPDFSKKSTWKNENREQQRQDNTTLSSLKTSQISPFQERQKKTQNPWNKKDDTKYSTNKSKQGLNDPNSKSNKDISMEENSKDTDGSFTQQKDSFDSSFQLQPPLSSSSLLSSLDGVLPVSELFYKSTPQPIPSSSSKSSSLPDTNIVEDHNDDDNIGLADEDDDTDDDGIVTDDEELPFSAEQTNRIYSNGNKIHIRRNVQQSSTNEHNKPHSQRKSTPPQRSSFPKKNNQLNKRKSIFNENEPNQKSNRRLTRSSQSNRGNNNNSRSSPSNTSRKMVRRGMEMLVGGDPINADPPLRFVELTYNSQTENWVQKISLNSRDFGPLLHTPSISKVSEISRGLYCENFVSSALKWKVCPEELQMLVQENEFLLHEKGKRKKSNVLLSYDDLMQQMIMLNESGSKEEQQNNNKKDENDKFQKTKVTAGKGFENHSKKKKKKKANQQKNLSSSSFFGHRVGNKPDQNGKSTALEGGELKFSVGINKSDLENENKDKSIKVLGRILSRGISKAIRAKDLGFTVVIDRLLLAEIDNGITEISVLFKLVSIGVKKKETLRNEIKQINQALFSAVNGGDMAIALAASVKEDNWWPSSLKDQFIEELLFETDDADESILMVDNDEEDEIVYEEDSGVKVKEDNVEVEKSFQEKSEDSKKVVGSKSDDNNRVDTGDELEGPFGLPGSDDFAPDDIFLSGGNGGVFFDYSESNINDSPYKGVLGPLLLDAVVERAKQRQPRVIAIGDVHGCLDELQALLRRCDYRPGDLVVFLGDLVSKGPDSLSVVQMAREIGALGVRGNHDFEVIRWHQAIMSGADPPVIGSEHFHIASGLGKADLKWLYCLPWYLSSKELGALFVHAGFVSGIRLAKQNPRLMMNMRSILPDGTVTSKFFNNWPWARLWDGPQTVLFGHDADRGLQQYEHAIGLDTGCVYGGRLTACILPEKRLVSVSAKREYFQYRRKHFD